VLALVIDTSSAAVTAGVVDCLRTPGAAQVTVLGERVTVDARAHGELLAPSIRDALAQAGASFAELAAVVAGVGPGPFTGLRVGLVTAAAIADSVGMPAYDVCSLDAIAVASGFAGRLLVAGDARRREVYWAGYLDGARLTGPAVASAADVRAQLDRDELERDKVGQLTVAMTGTGARLYAEALGLPLLDTDFPTVAALGALAADRIVAAAPSEPLTPLYLRRPDAMAPTARKPVTP
jgi:tRNA threonylcarbamoyladenosine biosynthesis protein TsaB